MPQYNNSQVTTNGSSNHEINRGYGNKGGGGGGEGGCPSVE